MPSMRFKVPCRDVPPASAARMLGMTLEAFKEKLPDLLARRPVPFPSPDPTTGNFDMKAIEQWQNLRHPQIFPQDVTPQTVSDSSLTRERLRAVR